MCIYIPTELPFCIPQLVVGLAVLSYCKRFICFQGTHQQLVRNLGSEKAASVLRKLRLVFISHLHADHHLGLVNLLLNRQAAFGRGEGRPDLFLAAPAKISFFLGHYHRDFEPVLDGVRLVRNEQLLVAAGRGVIDRRNSHAPPPPLELDAILPECGLASLETCRAVHCPSSFCVSLTTAKDYRLLYSGDTRPCQDFVELARKGRGVGREPDLLIHEATMGHDLLQDAMAKRHSTITEAMLIAEAMRARSVILTHFSQRYSKVPTLDEFKESGRTTSVCLAFDHMTVSPQTLPWTRVGPLVPVLEACFAEEMRQMEEKRAKLLTREEEPMAGEEEVEEKEEKGHKRKKPIVNKPMLPSEAMY